MGWTWRERGSICTHGMERECEHIYTSTHPETESEGEKDLTIKRKREREREMLRNYAQ
jgi:hypothetical protein